MSIKWGSPFQQWSERFSIENLWRVRNILPTREDAFQHCALIFSRVLNEYGDNLEGRHFMALFQAAVYREFDTLAKRNRRRLPNTLVEPDFDVEEADYSYERCLFQGISEEVQSVLKALFQSPGELADYFVMRGERKCDEEICKRLGIKYFPVRKRIKEMFNG